MTTTAMKINRGPRNSYHIDKAEIFSLDFVSFGIEVLERAKSKEHRIYISTSDIETNFTLSIEEIEILSDFLKYVAGEINDKSNQG